MLQTFTRWKVDATQILTRTELSSVLASLRRRARRLPNVKMNLALVRLACCCGLRASEIAGLRLGARCGHANARCINAPETSGLVHEA